MREEIFLSDHRKIHKLEYKNEINKHAVYGFCILLANYQHFCGGLCIQIALQSPPPPHTYAELHAVAKVVIEAKRLLPFFFAILCFLCYAFFSLSHSQVNIGISQLFCLLKTGFFRQKVPFSVAENSTKIKICFAAAFKPLKSISI